MKNLFVFLAFALLAISACTEKVDNTAQNKAVFQRYIDEVWNKGKLSVVDEIFASNYINHDTANPALSSPAGIKQLVTKYRSAFPDVRLTIDDQIAEGDKVVTRYTWSGTHKGNLEGIAATGKHATGAGIVVSRISGGKIQEEWTIWDALGLMQQLGVVPPTETTMK